MHIDQHALVLEFPDLKQRIHQLKMQDQHFARQFDEYHDIDHNIVRIEDGIEHCSDAELETMKKQRLLLKDALYGRLVNPS